MVAGCSWLGKELVEKCGGSAHQHQTAVFGTIRCIVEKTLNGLHPDGELVCPVLPQVLDVLAPFAPDSDHNAATDSS